MGWFDEQIKQRKVNDDNLVSDSFIHLADSVLGKKLAAKSMKNQQVQEAVGEILQFYHITPAELPENMSDLNEELEYLMRPHGLMRRKIQLKGTWEKDAVGAMLGVKREDDSIVALIPGKVSGYSFYDFQKEKRVKINGRNRDSIAEEAMAFYKPFPMRKMSLLDFVIYIKNLFSLSDVLSILFFFAGITFLGLLTPKLNEILFSKVVTSGSMQMLLSMGIFFLCLQFSQSMLSMARSLCMSRVQTKLDISVEAATMMRILSLPPAFFKKYSAGELSSYAQQMNGLCTTFMNTIFLQGLSSIFSLIYITQIFQYAPALVIPALGVILTTVILSMITAFREMRISAKQIELRAKKAGMTYAMITGVQKIKLAGAEKRAFARWGNQYAKEAAYLYNPPLFLKVNGVLTLAVTLMGNLLMYYLAVKTQVSVSNYYAFSVSFGMVSGAFNAMAGVVMNMATIKPIIDHCKPIMDAEPEISSGKTMIDRISGNIEMSHVSFKYAENMPLVLDNISLKIRSGEYVAIVGKTGCGKSTLLRLLLGFEKPEKGAIYYDGRDLNSIDLKSLRRKIGVVMQNGSLFTGDIYSNIVISAPWLNQQAAWDAAEIAGIAEDIREMPMGMQTMIQEGSGGISGGQKQRIMIARAVAPKPKVLMLDEATSALDNQTQKQVSDALDTMKCTRIVIAHRLSTVKHCDRIIVLNEGHIIEDGNYEDLIAKKGYFAELVERQRLH